MTGRQVALVVVQRVFEDDSYADRVFRKAADRLDPRERAFAMQLAYGTVQRVRTLDHAIEALGGRPVRKLDSPVRAALRLGAYQLAYMDAVPAHAAVHETVELVRQAGLERAVAFTNAVMRRLTIGLDEVLERLTDRTPGEAALKHSYPDWIADRWWSDLGRAESLALMCAQNEALPTVVRVNRLRPGDILPGPMEVKQVDEELLGAGTVWPQSLGSQLAATVVQAAPGERVLDLCAAPGGKATQLAAEGAEVVAVEKHRGRARELEWNAMRLGAENVSVVCGDALELPEEIGDFDHVLVDAPCSGLGVLASRPDLRWRARPLPELQRALLDVAVRCAKLGGAITYAVCTINKIENEEVVDLVSAKPDPLGDRWPEYAHPRRSEYLLTLPHRHRTAGFFIARFRV